MRTTTVNAYTMIAGLGLLTKKHCCFGVFMVALLFAGLAQGHPSGIRFDGEESYVEVSEAAACVPGENSFTIELWVKTSTHAQGWNLPLEWPGGDRLYVGHNVGEGWNFAMASNGRRTDTNGDAWIADISGRWLFVQAVLSRETNEQTLRVYDRDKDTWHEATVSPASGQSQPEGPLFIPSHPEQYPFEGVLREVRFWHTARTRTDAMRDMHSGVVGDETGLVGCWLYAVDEDNRIADITANANHGAAVGGDAVLLVFAKDLEDMPVALGRTATVGPVVLWDPQRPFVYTWQLDGDPVPGAVETDENTLSIPSVDKGNAGDYQVIVTDPETGASYESRVASVYLAPEDWPFWRYDAARTSRTPVLPEEDLHVAWVRELPQPQRAWRPQHDDRGKLDFDVSYSPVVKGDRIFVPSNVTDSVTAYCIYDGTELWRTYADGPVRLAPATWEDRVYFIADDGYLYCVDGTDGSLVWKFQGGPTDERLLGNERIISFWAARGGPVIKDGIVYFAAGIWPLHGVFIYALDAERGDIVWVNDTTSSMYVRLPHGGATGIGSIAPQGYIAATEDQLVVAGGRTPPAILNRHTGKVEHMALRAKPEGHYAVHGDGMGHRRNEALAQRVQELQGYLDGPVFNKLVAHERVFVTTERGTLYCFASDTATPLRHAHKPAALKARSTDWAPVAHYLLDALGEDEGYALLLGAGSGDLLRELLYRSSLHVVVAEPSSERVRTLRDELAAADLYGRRAAVIQAEPATFAVQPYLFSIVASEDVEAAGLTADDAAMAHILERLRPYGGVAYLGARQHTEALLDAAVAANVDQVAAEVRDGHLFARRTGPLTGAGAWTHQYSDAANTNFSPDNIARAPLGLLWFGGPCNANILPRHGHGPLPQVAAGRTILPGTDTLSARCVYTGREVWERMFPGLGHPFTDLTLEQRFERGIRVHMHHGTGIGANKLGSPFVSLPDAVYVRYRTRIHKLAPESGESQAVFQLPVDPEHEGHPDWGYLSVSDGVIITTVVPQVFQESGYAEVYETMADLKREGWDSTSSEVLVALDAADGDVLWTREAGTGYRHNAIVAGGDRVFAIDGLSEDAMARLRRRGHEPKGAVLMALDPRTGTPIWTVDDNVFGTWLGYSAHHDLLLMGGRPGGLRFLDDEPGERIAVYQGDTGTLVWEKTLPAYWGPLAIGDDVIYMAPADRSGAGRAMDLMTGEQIKRARYDTEEAVEWTYRRRYGCNSHNVSANLITFRSGAAAYYDLEYDSGTGFFGGIRSGCTNNVVVADGVVNVPDYTRTCSCSYQHQTSVALIHMPEMSSLEAWTTYDAAPPEPRGHGINFGAPGRRVDRVADRVWHNADGTHRRHPAAIRESEGSHDWVLASNLEVTGEDGPIEITDLLPETYVVRLHFAELTADVQAGDRVFDVFVNDEKVLDSFDIVADAGGAFRGVVKEFAVENEAALRVQLQQTATATLAPCISGIEVYVQDVALAAHNR